MKIVTSWDVTQYDPVEIYTVWRNVFLRSSKRKKIYARLHSFKIQKKEIFGTYRVADKLRHPSVCGTPEKLMFVSPTKLAALGEDLVAHYAIDTVGRTA